MPVHSCPGCSFSVVKMAVIKIIIEDLLSKAYK